jgi:SAM-dependent methyltransferase
MSGHRQGSVGQLPDMGTSGSDQQYPRPYHFGDGWNRPQEAKMDSAEWDARYAGQDLVWGGEPNRFVAAELAPMPPGRALDVACGEGRNAIWLATRGWRTVGIDFSPAAIDRAHRLAGDAGAEPRTEFVVGDVVSDPLPPGPFDAVIVAYLHLPASDRGRALRAAARVLAPGGTLLVVGHDTSNLTEGVGGPQDATVLYAPEDILADLSGLGVAVERAERVRRPVETPDGTREAIDALVRVRRAESG